MADQLSLRGGTTAEHAVFTGANKEVTVDTTKKTLVVNDGATVGGHPLMRENGSNSALALGSAATPSLKFSGDPNTGIYSPGADQVAISTNDTGRLFVNASGNITLGVNSRSVDQDLVFSADTGSFTLRLNRTSHALQVIDNVASTTPLVLTSAGRVGVGSSSPAELLHIEGSTSPTIRIRNSTTGSTASPASTFLSFNGFNQEGRVRFEAQDRRSSVNGGFLNIATANTSNVLTDALHIDNAQRVGIGTTSPVAPLHVRTVVAGGEMPVLLSNNSAVAGTSVALYLSPSSGELTTGSIRAAAIKGICDTSNVSNLAFFTNSSGTDPLERLRITSAGNVGIGTMSPGALVDASNSTGTRIRSTYTSTTGTRDAGFEIFGDSAANSSFVYGGNTGITTISSLLGAALNIGGTEALRVDSSRRLLVGTSSTRNVGTVAHPIQNETPSGTIAGLSIVRNSADLSEGRITFGKTRSTTVGGTTSVASGDFLGTIAFAGANGTDLNNVAATISVVVDGDPTGSTTDLPGRIVFSTTPDGTASSTERFRITNDGVIAHDQPAPAAVNATATLTIANLKAGIITSTSAAATDMTLPTGTDTQAGFSGTYDNFTFEWSVINTGPSLVRVLAGTAHTVVGSGSVLTGTSGRFASRRTAANTFVSYRLS